MDPAPVDDPASEVIAALDALGIAFERFDHPPVFTADQAAEHWRNIKAMHVKNLFLRNKKGDRHFLVIAPIDRDVNLRALGATLGVDRLSFASPERLARHLGLTPGSVSIFGLLHDRAHRVALVLDEAITRAERLAFHPNINTSTLTIARADLDRFLASTGHVPRYLTL